MHIVKPAGTRGQQAVLDLLDAAAVLRSQVAPRAEQVPEILPYFDRLTEVVASFGLCELHVRSLEHSVALDGYEERRPSLPAEVDRLNEAGIASIGDARKTLRPLGRRWTGSTLPKKVGEPSPGGVRA